MALTLTDEAVAKAYIQTVREGHPSRGRAYKRVKPHVTQRTSEVEGSHVLKKPEVKAYLREALTLNDLQAELRECLEESKKEGDRREWRGAVMDYAKLAGLIVDKQEVKSFDDRQIEQLRVIALDVIKQTGGAPPTG